MTVLTFISRKPKVLGRPRYRTFIPLLAVKFISRPNKLRKVKRKKFFLVKHRIYLFPGAAVTSTMVLQRVWRVYLRR